MAETASILSPDKTVLIPDLDAGCSLADSITPEQLTRLAGQAPRRDDRHVRQHDGRDQGADRLLRDVVQRGQGRPAHPRRARAGHADPLRPRHVARRVRREGARRSSCTSGTASATSTPASARRTSPRCAPSIPTPTSSSTPSAAARRRSWSTSPPVTSPPRACTCSRPAGCSTTPRSTPARAARRSWRPRPACSTRSAWPPPTSTSSPPTSAPSCQYMKMITLPKLRDCLRDLSGEVKVDPALAERARMPIERMVAIG